MYDYVIITHIPAFYKINLYNEIVKKKKIFVIFISSATLEKRSDDFSKVENARFEYIIINSVPFQHRDRMQSIISVYNILRKVKFRKLLVGGWDLIEFWFAVIYSPLAKNCLALESTICESNVGGLRGLLKRFFLSRISVVFASGGLHVKLLERLDYKREVLITRGVGIINKPEYKCLVGNISYRRRYLFVGRMIAEKNLNKLIDVFNSLPDYTLTMVGDGPIKANLMAISKENIKYLPSMENIKLKDIFCNNDIFILPSISEPWGLVVEESIYFDLPVIVSRNCGASELIVDGVNGIIIDPNDSEEMEVAITKITDELYNKLQEGVDRNYINNKDAHQVDCYINL